jgi:hypothetical protein
LYKRGETVRTATRLPWLSAAARAAAPPPPRRGNKQALPTTVPQEAAHAPSSSLSHGMQCASSSLFLLCYWSGSNY